MTPLQFEALPRAIGRWLSFQRFCGRDVMFSESYLVQPIAEFILHHHSGHIEPEYPHPAFKTGKRGRPKQVDFALLTPHARDVEQVIESKWVRDRDYAKQAIVDDLLRLECFRDSSGRYVTRYFLLAGLLDHIDKHFLSLKFRDGRKNVPFTRRFLSDKKALPHTNIDAVTPTGSIRQYYREFQKMYKCDVPKHFNTTLVSRYRIPGDVGVYLWRVGSIPHRTVFTARKPGW
jgi:hypothetical protein